MGGDAETPSFHFYLCDHEGNNRVVTDINGNIEQVNDYTPFGVLMKNDFTATSTQRYKYNGKELDRMHGLDLYDYGARMYDSPLGRWHVMDPLCEKYYNVSPYVYCHNNPINKTDPTGMEDFFNENGTFNGRKGEGSAIMIQEGQRFVNIDEYNFSNNPDVIKNIASYYLCLAGDSKPEVSVVKTDKDAPPGAVMAFVSKKDEYEFFLQNGYVNKEFNNCYNFECCAFHEYTHRKDNTTRDGNMGEVTTIINVAKNCPAWEKASISYVWAQASYAVMSINKASCNPAMVSYQIDKLNNAFAGKALFNYNDNQVEMTACFGESIIISTKK